MLQTSREKREERKERKRQQSEDVNAILCNSVKMIREKLTVSEGRVLICHSLSVSLRGIPSPLLYVGSPRWEGLIHQHLSYFVVLFSESKTEEKALEKEGYVYDFYYPSDNYYGRLGDM